MHFLFHLDANEQAEKWGNSKKTDQFIQLVKCYTDFSELTTSMLNEFIEKVIVHEGEGMTAASVRNRRQRKPTEAGRKPHSRSPRNIMSRESKGTLQRNADYYGIPLIHSCIYPAFVKRAKSVYNQGI